MFFSKPKSTSKGVIPLGDLKLAEEFHYDVADAKFTGNAEKADTVTSLVEEAGFYHWKRNLDREDTYHKPVIELEVPVYVTVSSDGNHQLHIDKMMPWMQYRLFLWVLATCGIIERSYYIETVRRGHSLLWLPWVRRPEKKGKTW
jgi:hypothetical protein